jgi:hypothetical protein
LEPGKINMAWGELMQHGCGLNQKPPLYSAAPSAAPPTDDKITLPVREKNMVGRESASSLDKLLHLR